MDNFFYSIYTNIASKKKLSFGLLVTLVLCLVFVASKIEFEEDITKLIPTNGKSSQTQKALKQVNFADKIIVNIGLGTKGSIDDLTRYATQFIDSIKASSTNNYIHKIQGQVENKDVQNTLDFIYANLPLFLDDNDYNLIKNKLEKDSIATITNNNYKTLISPSGFITKKTILKDPLGLSFMGLKKLQSLSFGDNFSLYNGFLLSKNKNHILLFITPKLKSSETAENAKFAKNLYSIRDALDLKFKNKVSGEYFGGVLIAVANAKQIKKDIQLTVGIAISVLLIILILFYRKISLPIILFIPTVFGALLAISILFLIRTQISAISLGIGSILLGITLDYSLHILTHIRSNNNMQLLYKEITKPIIMSSLTTALAFLCLLFLKSQALQDLGIFAAVSVLSASFFALIFIPQVYKDAKQKQSKKTLIDTIASYSFHKNKIIIIGLVLIMAISLFAYNKVTFNKDLNALNFQPQELLDAQNRLDALTNISSKSVYLAAYGDTNEDALQVNDTIFTVLDNLKKQHKIIEYSSISSVIKSEATQHKKITKWQSFWTSETTQSTKHNLIESGNTLGFKPKTFNQFFKLLDKEFNTIDVLDYNIKTISVEDYITSSDNFATVATLVKVQDQHLLSLINTFKDFPETVIINRKHMNETFLGNLKTDFNRLVLYSSIIVFIILLVFYRSLSLTLVSSIPIALTWLITIGIMGLFHIQFNIFNIIISTFIFGLGIDYSIFITNGLLHQYRTGEKTLPIHKTSIILSVITTILGVGVLIFAKHPALHSISLVSIIGILSAMAISFTIQPLLFKLFIGSKTKRPISLRLLVHSSLSFSYYGFGSFILGLFSASILKIIPISKKVKMNWFHRVLSKFMKSVLYTNPFFSKTIINPYDESFKKQAVIIANHTSFLDILAIGMLSPKIIFLVNDWVYNSPVFGRAVKLAGFYPVSSGIENGLSHLQKKVNQGYSLMVFPEGTRSLTNKVKRFHKGAFYLAEQFNLDILPVLIHGNSEVLPKGSFIIKGGSLTLKILKRISSKNLNYGKNYTGRTKKISAHFKEEFNLLRNEIESDSYFHKIVLEDFRYKDDAIYKLVKADLKTNSVVYKTILNTISNKHNILHISEDCGQLDFLLSLDRPDRKIHTYIKNAHNRLIVMNSFITNNYSISIYDTITEIIDKKADVAILNSEILTQAQITTIFNNGVSIFILLKESRNLYTSKISLLGFNPIFESKTLIILKR